jgi:hypothetical protein
LLIAWLVYPLVLAVLALGCGLLLEYVARVRLPRPLLLPAGLAVIVVAGLFPIMNASTAELTTPLIVVLAAAGLWLSRNTLRSSRPDWASVACAVAVFGVYAAPILFSGHVTISAYQSQIDTATYLGVTDRILEHGRDLSDLRGGEYTNLLDVLLPEGYPLGSLVPFGVGQRLVGQDAAWLFQPYLAFVAAMLSLSLYALLTRVVASRPLRAAIAFVASQPALLYALAFWAGIKELSAAWVIALLAALVTLAVRDEVRGRALSPLALATAATLGMLSFAGAIWVVPLLLGALVVVVRLKGRAFAWRRSAEFIGLTAVLALPALSLTGEFWKEATAVDVTGESLGVLLNSLSPRQLFGIWPAGNFQATPGAVGLTNVLIGLVFVFAIAALVWAIRRRSWELALYVGGSAVSAMVITAFGSPWIDAKTFAIVSPAVVLAALVGALMIPTHGRRIAGAAVACAIAAGVLWSNALAYHDVQLAPRDRFEELKKIAHQIDGEGPTLLVEYEPYASRHFLRNAELVAGPSDVYGGVIQRPGGGVRLFQTTKVIDTEEYGIQGLLPYQTIVRRASVLESRPPSLFKLVWRGRHYEVWQQVRRPRPVLNHVALGSGAQPAVVPDCSLVRAVARQAGPQGQVATVERQPPTVARLLPEPVWSASIESEKPVPDDLRTGSVRGNVTVPAAGRYTIGTTGFFNRRIQLLVDGQPVDTERREQIGSEGDPYLLIGTRQLNAGRHPVELRYGEEGALHPGIGGHAALVSGQQSELRRFSFGPLVLRRDDVTAPITYLPSSRAGSLCGKRLDWLESLGPVGSASPSAALPSVTVAP